MVAVSGAIAPSEPHPSSHTGGRRSRANQRGSWRGSTFAAEIGSPDSAELADRAAEEGRTQGGRHARMPRRGTNSRARPAPRRGGAPPRRSAASPEHLPRGPPDAPAAPAERPPPSPVGPRSTARPRPRRPCRTAPGQRSARRSRSRRPPSRTARGRESRARPRGRARARPAARRRGRAALHVGRDLPRRAARPRRWGRRGAPQSEGMLKEAPGTSVVGMVAAGALLGLVLGRNRESALTGAAIGGLAGLLGVGVANAASSPTTTRATVELLKILQKIPIPAGTPKQLGVSCESEVAEPGRPEGGVACGRDAAAPLAGARIRLC